MAALLMMALLAGCGTGSTIVPGIGPPPALIGWDSAATAGIATPQAAFAHAAKLTPCAGAPARSVTLDWLVATSVYGAVLIQPDCQGVSGDRQRPRYALLEVAYEAEGEWVADTMQISQRPAAGSSAVGYSGAYTAPPAWLALPSDTYDSTSQSALVDGQRSELVGWYSLSRTYLAGRARGHPSAADLAGSSAVHVNGVAGSLMHDQGGVDVVVPLADGSTFFFVGTGTAAQVLRMSGLVLAHLGALLPPLGASPYATAQGAG